MIITLIIIIIMMLIIMMIWGIMTLAGISRGFGGELGLRAGMERFLPSTYLARAPFSNFRLAFFVLK